MDALDLWLRRGLHSLYSAVAAEPIPPALLRLIEDAQQQSEQGGERLSPSQGLETSLVETEHGFEQRVRERAYFLWLEEGCPAGRALEHWMLAFTQQAAQEAHEHSAGQEGHGSFLTGGSLQFRHPRW
jgi:hypothetical protein